jgi:hypothetical protein
LGRQQPLPDPFALAVLEKDVAEKQHKGEETNRQHEKQNDD